MKREQALNRFDEQRRKMHEAEEEAEPDIAQDWTADLSAKIDYIIPFPGIARDIQQWILDSSFKPQPALALAATFSILSVCVGRSIQCEGIKGNILTLCLAESGEGKDWPLKAARKILQSVNLLDHAYGQMASGAALVDAICETPSALLLLDEIGHYFAGINSKNANQYSKEIMPIVTELYTSASDSYQEKKRKGQVARTIIEPNLSMMGISTERQIMDTLRSSEVADGSLARFLVLFGSTDVRINRKRISRARIPESIKDGLNALISTYSKPMMLCSTELGIDESYAEYKFDVEDRINLAAINLTDSRAQFKPFYHRQAVRAVQLALLLDQCQSIDVLEWCLKLVEQSTDVFIKKFCHLAADNDTERFVKIIERAIKEAGKKGISKQKFYDKTKQVNSQLKKAILADMIESQKIFIREQHVDGSQKPSTFYYWRK